jgi:hypothetical protein
MTEIETNTSIKQLFRNRYGQYLSCDNVDDVYFLYKLTLHLKSDDRINSLESDLGNQYHKIMKLYRAFVPKYEMMKHCREIIQNSTNKAVRTEFQHQLERLSMEIPIVNEAIVLVFTSLIKNTDLKNIPVLSASAVQKPETQSMVFSEEY